MIAITEAHGVAERVDAIQALDGLDLVTESNMAQDASRTRNPHAVTQRPLRATTEKPQLGTVAR
jgi:hypothetical protein